MTNSLGDSLLDAMGDFIRREGYEVAVVTGYEEFDYSTGYCETCYYEEVRLRIDYQRHDGTEYEYEYYGDFADFIRELTTPF